MKMSNKTVWKGVIPITRYFKWRKPMAYLLKPFWRWRAKRISEHVLPYIPVRARVIDIGAGTGLLAEEISKKRNIQVTIIDVIDWNTSSLPLKIFDGEHIPFGSKQFDVAILIDVLHHAEDEEALVKEAVRVAKKVIISEEVHEEKKREVLANIGDIIQVVLYGMSVGWHHRSKESWLEFLNKISPSFQWTGNYKDPNPLFRDPNPHALFVGSLGRLERYGNN